jgi:tetratricopeptide (TPR) repeat protein
VRKLILNIFLRDAGWRCANPACDRYGTELPAGAAACEACMQAPEQVMRPEWRAVVVAVAAALALVAVCWYGTSRLHARHLAERQALAQAGVRTRAEHGLARGQAMIGRRQYTEARQEFTEVTRVDPGNAMAWASLGAVDMVLGDAGEALHCYDQALALDPGNWLAHYNLALHSARHGDREAAFAHLRQALAALPAASRERREVIADLLGEPALQEVRGDARFAGLLGGEAAGAGSAASGAAAAGIAGSRR